MDLFDAIEGRFTAPGLTDPAPDAADLRKILTAGIMAPDHGRLAPWRFAVLHGATRNLLADAMAALKRATDPDAPETAIAAEQRKALRAPLIVVVAAHIVPHPKVPEIEQLLAVAACVQNMCLAAQALGYCANWKTGPAAHAPEVARALGFAANDRVVAILYLGSAAAPATRRDRVLDPAWLVTLPDR